MQLVFARENLNHEIQTLNELTKIKNAKYINQTFREIEQFCIRDPPFKLFIPKNINQPLAISVISYMYRYP